MYIAHIKGENIVVEEDANEVFNIGGYGCLEDETLYLKTYEAMNLLERDKIEIKENGKTLDREEFFRRACEINKDFPHLNTVYQDLRKRGYLVRAGMNFPADLRVYERGTSYNKQNKLKHVKWLLDVVKTNRNFSLSKSASKIDKAKNIRAQIALGIVDEEGDVTYYKLNEENKLNKAERMEEKYSNEKVEGYLYDDLIFVWDDKEKIYEPGYFGKMKDNRLELNLLEAVYLVERDNLTVHNKKDVLTAEELKQTARNKDSEFDEKYDVYSDLRDKGFLVRAGFKFGTHFRLYDRGVKLKKGSKKPSEHTKWVVHSVPKNFTWSYPELSRFVRLALNIRSKPTLAVVNDEKKYYRMVRVKP